VDGVSNNNITFTKTGGQSIEANDLSVSVAGNRTDTPFNGGSWQTGQSREANVSADTYSSEQTVRIIHDPSGNTIFQQTVDFSN
ncbi:type IV pilin, partial [Halorubrum sp. E3]